MVLHDDFSRAESPDQGVISPSVILLDNLLIQLLYSFTATSSAFVDAMVQARS